MYKRYYDLSHSHSFELALNNPHTLHKRDHVYQCFLDQCTLTLKGLPGSIILHQVWRELMECKSREKYRLFISNGAWVVREVATCLQTPISYFHSPAPHTHWASWRWDIILWLKTSSSDIRTRSSLTIQHHPHSGLQTVGVHRTSMWRCISVYVYLHSKFIPKKCNLRGLKLALLASDPSFLQDGGQKQDPHAWGVQSIPTCSQMKVWHHCCWKSYISFLIYSRINQVGDSH